MLFRSAPLHAHCAPTPPNLGRCVQLTLPDWHLRHRLSSLHGPLLFGQAFEFWRTRDLGYCGLIVVSLTLGVVVFNLDAESCKGHVLPSTEPTAPSPSVGPPRPQWSDENNDIYVRRLTVKWHAPDGSSNKKQLHRITPKLYSGRSSHGGMT